MKKRMALRNQNTCFLAVSIILVICILLSVPAFAAKCVNPKGTNGCFDAIQDAVNAAVPGEKVKVRPGNYYGYVTIPAGRNGLILEGTGDTRNDVKLIGEPGDSTSVIESYSAQVTLQNFTTIHGNGISIEPGLGAGTRIINVKVVGADFHCIRVGGDPSPPTNDIVINKCDLSGPSGIIGNGERFKVRNTTIRSINPAIDLNGIDALVENCVSKGGNGPFNILIAGNNATVRNTRVTSNRSSEGIHIDGNNAVVEENVLDGVAIFVIGGNPLVKNNSVSDVDGPPFGFHINCTGDCSQARVVKNTAERALEGFNVHSDVPGMVVKKNKAVSCESNGFGIFGSEITVTENIARSCLNNGFYLTGGNNTVSDNISEKNSGQGFEILSGLNTLSENTASQNQGLGFDIPGSDNDILNNKANDNLVSGIEVVGSNNALNGNKVRRNIFNGIHVFGNFNTIEGNTALMNQFDICDEGTGNILTDNTYDTECP